MNPFFKFRIALLHGNSLSNPVDEHNFMLKMNHLDIKPYVRVDSYPGDITLN